MSRSPITYRQLEEEFVRWVTHHYNNQRVGIKSIHAEDIALRQIADRVQNSLALFVLHHDDLKLSGIHLFSEEEGVVHFQFQAVRTAMGHTAVVHPTVILKEGKDPTRATHSPNYNETIVFDLLGRHKDKPKRGDYVPTVVGPFLRKSMLDNIRENSPVGIENKAKLQAALDSGVLAAHPQNNGGDDEASRIIEKITAHVAEQLRNELGQEKAPENIAVVLLLNGSVTMCALWDHHTYTITSSVKITTDIRAVPVTPPNNKETCNMNIDEFNAKSFAFQNGTNAVANALDANPNLAKFYTESIVVTGGAGFTDTRAARVLKILKKVLTSQGVDPSVISIVQNENDRSGGALQFDFFGEFIANAPGGAYNSGQSIEFTVHTNNVFTFLGRRDAALGTMAKNFLNGVGNVASNQPNGPITLEDLGTWVSNFRDVFPRLEANQF